MSVQVTLNLPVRKTRLQSKLESVIGKSEISSAIQEELPKRRLRQKKQTKDSGITVVKSPVKRSSPTKLTESSPSKRGVLAPTDDDRVKVAVRSLFTSPRKAAVKDVIAPNEQILRMSPRKILRDKNAIYDENHSERKTTNSSVIQDFPRTSPRKVNRENNPLRSPSKNKSPMKKHPTKHAEVKVTKAETSHFTQAKQALHTQLTELIVGRDEEIKKLTSFIQPALSKKTSTSLYVSGAPGTGKTVSLTYVLEKLSSDYKFSTVFINCMTVKNASSIYSKIAEGLSLESSTLEGLQEGIKKKSCVVVLDEVDQLRSHNQQILYSLFELPKFKGSKVILVGIANALDLTDKTVPLLQAYGCRPQLYHFAPYSDKQIVAILKSRLSDSSVVVKPVALIFLAKKIATCTGDVRKALDICRRAIEIVERKVRQQRVLATKVDTKEQTAAVVDISHISQVMSDVFNTRICGTQNLHTTLPLQQKLLLCALLVIAKRKSLKEITMNKLQEVYGRVCKLAKVPAIDYSELLSLITLLESRALVCIKKSKESRQSKVRLAVDEIETEQVLQDQNILALCMAETSIC